MTRWFRKTGYIEWTEMTKQEVFEIDKNVKEMQRTSGIYNIPLVGIFLTAPDKPGRYIHILLEKDQPPELLAAKVTNAIQSLLELNK